MKQVMVVRTDLKMRKGKLAGQVAHASLKSYQNTPSKIREEWDNTDYTKIILKCNNIEEIYNLQEKADKEGISNFIVHDQGRTQIPQNSVTCIGIGPDTGKKIDKIVKHLKLY